MHKKSYIKGSPQRPHSILALDLGATTGYCFMEDGVVKASGAWFFAGPRPERERGLLLKLQWAFQAYDVDAVVYERPICRGLHATRSLWGMAGVAEAVACGSAAVLDVQLQTLKTWAGPAGEHKKSATLNRCVELGVIPVDDNHADAVCLAFYALEHMEIEP